MASAISSARLRRAVSWTPTSPPRATTGDRSGLCLPSAPQRSPCCSPSLSDRHDSSCRAHDDTGQFRRALPCARRDRRRPGCTLPPRPRSRISNRWPELHALEADDDILQMYLTGHEGLLRQYTEAKTYRLLKTPLSARKLTPVSLQIIRPSQTYDVC